MKQLWNLTGLQLPREELDARRVDSVLVEFDGPEIVAVLGPDGKRRLSVACDESDAAVRWLEATLVAEQWLQLYDGSLSIRDALTANAEAWVIEQSHDGRVLGGWKVDPRQLPDELLPERDSPLPAETRNRLCAGPRVVPATLHQTDAAVDKGQAAMHRRVA